MDLISRQAAIDRFEPWLKVKGYNEGELNMLKAVLYELKCLPSAEPEREMGRWMFSHDYAEGICTNCNYKIYGRPYNNAYLIVPYNFCPNCGADMRGEGDG